MPNQWFRVPRPRPNARVQIFLFHHAGGSSASYTRWLNLIPEEVEPVLCELPGRGPRYQEPPIEDFNTLISAMKPAFENQIRGDAILFGHSLGALVAFELYRSLSDPLTQNIRGLGLSSFLPPSAENMHRREKISHLPEEEFITKLKVYASLPMELLQDLGAREYFINLIRKDIRLIESYQSSDFTHRKVPMLILGGQEDPQVPFDRLQSWSNFGNPFEPISSFPGGHFYISAEYPKVINLVLSRLGDKI